MVEERKRDHDRRPIPRRSVRWNLQTRDKRRFGFGYGRLQLSNIESARPGHDHVSTEDRLAATHRAHARHPLPCRKRQHQDQDLLQRGSTDGRHVEERWPKGGGDQPHQVHGVRRVPDHLHQGYREGRRGRVRRFHNERQRERERLVQRVHHRSTRSAERAARGDRREQAHVHRLVAPSQVRRRRPRHPLRGGTSRRQPRPLDHRLLVLQGLQLRGPGPDRGPGVSVPRDGGERQRNGPPPRGDQPRQSESALRPARPAWHAESDRGGRRFREPVVGEAGDGRRVEDPRLLDR